MMAGVKIEAKKDYFEFDSNVGLDEDERHEFKSHRSLSIEEVPSWCVEEVNNKLNRSRQPVSKTICAFLNTGLGRAIYIGVLDNGVVKGIKFTNYQRDHLLVSLRDLCSRFAPPIPVEMINVAFVPVVSRAFVEEHPHRLEKVINGEQFDHFEILG